MPQGAGPAVRLRKPVPDDFPVMRTIREDVETQHLLLAYPHAERAPAEAWFERKMADTQTVFLVATDDAGHGVGYVQFSGLHRAGRHASFGIAIAARRRGQGYGRAAVIAALDHARKALDLRKLLLEVRSDNLAARKIYADLGFRTVGRMVDHYFDGERFHDVDLMEKAIGGDAG